MVTVTTLAVLVAPRLFGWTPYVVTSGSMSPTFNAGAVIVAAPTDGMTLRVGDVVSFNTESGMTTHRVVERRTARNGDSERVTYVTKGDANKSRDPAPLDPRNVVGTAKFGVPLLGYAVNFVKTPAGAGALAALVLLLLFTGGESRKASQSTKVHEPAVTS
ncbi:signal peptidase I [Nocardioides pakistanensis]